MNEFSEGQGPVSPQIDFGKALTGVRNYAEVRAAIAGSIEAMKQRGFTRIGFVSGPLGEETMEKDMGDMSRIEAELQTINGYPFVSSADIFFRVWRGLKETSLPREERSARMKELFDGILHDGVTDIFMMDGWRKADGCKRENETAKKVGIKIHELGLDGTEIFPPEESTS